MSGLLDQLLATPAWLALLVVFALPALESSAFLGFLFPGETAVLMGGVVASHGHVPVAAVLAAGIGGAVLGDAVGYGVGRRWGRTVLGSTLGRFVRESHLARAEGALLARGGWAVFLGRFTVALRVMIPGLAGMARMPFRRFAVANVAGGVVWGAVMVMIGYLAGNGWRSVGHAVTHAGTVLVVGVVVVAILVRVVRRARRGRGAERGHRRWGDPRRRSDRPGSGATRTALR